VLEVTGEKPLRDNRAYLGNLRVRTRVTGYVKKHEATGQVLWEYQLPAGGYSTPCTYSVGGRQYVVIAAGGGGKLGTKSGSTYIAFALP